LKPFLKTSLQALVLLLVAGFSIASMAAPPATDDTRTIEALIQSVAQLKGAAFIRNGSEYSAVQAADHLRLKWRKAGSRVHTAEQFIDLCATQSSMSGLKYRIRLADGVTVDSADFLRARLIEIRKRGAIAAPTK